ncbi:MAG: alpha-amylase [Chloroflexi bacterium]|nr:alpha-amylase [Chloroflexota bacterium]
MRHVHRWLLLLVFVLVAGCVFPPITPVPPTPTDTPAPTDTPTPSPTLTPTPEGVGEREPHAWWNDAVFYEIFVRSFYDSDGDGVGDLNGLIEKLDYLNDGDPATTDDLGITGIWLMPIMESPSYHGYDVADYYRVDPEYGTNEDFRRLMAEAHRRGIRVIIDMVLNHTSSKHPWFQSARSDPNSPYRDFYIWSDQDPGYKGPWGQRVWHRSPTGYYYGIFWAGMPDLNYDNPAVTAEMEKVIRFWLEDMGVDGFRLDAVKHLVEEGRVQENTPATHAWLRGFYAFYESINPEALTVGEVWSPTTEVVKYIGDQLDLAFEFDTAQAMLRSARFGDRSYVLRAHRLVTERYPPNQFATFLTNHDQPRVMTELRGDVNKAKVAASLLLTGPGVPFLYYGEEIGQVGGKPDENIRTPMQWSDAENAGFTTAVMAWRAPQPDYRDVNVAAQTGDPNSLLSHYRRLVRARNAHEALRVGDWREVTVEDRRIYAFLRHSDAETLLVLINLSGEPISDYRLDLESGPLSGEPVEGLPVEVLTGEPAPAPAVREGGGFEGYRPLGTLEPYGTYVIRLR